MRSPDLQSLPDHALFAPDGLRPRPNHPITDLGDTADSRLAVPSAKLSKSRTTVADNSGEPANARQSRRERKTRAREHLLQFAAHSLGIDRRSLHAERPLYPRS